MFLVKNDLEKIEQIEKILKQIYDKHSAMIFFESNQELSAVFDFDNDFKNLLETLEQFKSNFSYLDDKFNDDFQTFLNENS